MTEVVFHRDIGTHTRPIDHAWNHWCTSRPGGTFDYWLKKTHNLEYEIINMFDVKIIGSEKDITWFLLRWS